MITTDFVRFTFALAETIRELRQVPNGEMYAAMMTKGLTFAAYSEMISALKRAGLVVESANMLRWVGPDVRNN